MPFPSYAELRNSLHKIVPIDIEKENERSKALTIAKTEQLTKPSTSASLSNVIYYKSRKIDPQSNVIDYNEYLLMLPSCTDRNWPHVIMRYNILNNSYETLCEYPEPEDIPNHDWTLPVIDRQNEKLYLFYASFADEYEYEYDKVNYTKWIFDLKSGKFYTHKTEFTNSWLFSLFERRQPQFHVINDIAHSVNLRDGDSNFVQHWCINLNENKMSSSSTNEQILDKRNNTNDVESRYNPPAPIIQHKNGNTDKLYVFAMEQLAVYSLDSDHWTLETDISEGWQEIWSDHSTICDIWGDPDDEDDPAEQCLDIVDFTVILGFQDVVFVICDPDIRCLDLIQRKWYKSDRKLPNFTRYEKHSKCENRWERTNTDWPETIISTEGRYAYYFKANDTDDESINVKIDLFDIIPDALQEVVMKRITDRQKLASGFVRSYANKVISVELVSLILSFHSQPINME